MHLMFTALANFSHDFILCRINLTPVIFVLRYGDDVANTTEENSSIFSLIRMR